MSEFVNEENEAECTESLSLCSCCTNKSKGVGLEQSSKSLLDTIAKAAGYCSSVENFMREKEIQQTTGDSLYATNNTTILCLAKEVSRRHALLDGMEHNAMALLAAIIFLHSFHFTSL
jgi:hypothetical protein